jgi:hypothetical protein
VAFGHPDKQVVRATKNCSRQHNVIAKAAGFRDIQLSMSESHLVDLRPPFIDARGEIVNLLDLPMGSVSLITSNNGAVRANHYHKTDWHYCWMQKGSMDYYYRPVGSKEPAKYIRVEEGQMVYTPSMEEHAMVFTAPAAMWCFAGNPRTAADYESDTVRVDSIVPVKPTV